MKVTVELEWPAMLKLLDYLKSHESDIADNVNDFGDLWELWVEFYGEAPQVALRGNSIRSNQTEWQSPSINGLFEGRSYPGPYGPVRNDK